MNQAIIHDVACFGEVLWDLLPSGPQPGGAPMNVVYHLQQLGRKPAMISRTGNDKRGRELLNVLRKKGISAQYLQTDEQVPTGIVNATQNANGDMQYDIVSPAAWDHITADAAAVTLVSQAAYFVFGTLSARHSTSRETLFSLLKAARLKVLDINLRPPHFTQDLIERLLHEADILKLNTDELELVSGYYTAAGDISDRLTLLQQRFDIGTIILTMGANGAMLRIKEQTYQHPGFRVKVMDTVGSGDSFLAAVIAGLLNGDDPEAILDKANRLAATITTYKGAMPDYDMAETEVIHLKTV